MTHVAATLARCSVLPAVPALHACMHQLCTMPPLYGCTMHTHVAWLPRKTVLSTGGLSTKLIECRLLERGPPFGAGRVSEGAIHCHLCTTMHRLHHLHNACTCNHVLRRRPSCDMPLPLPAPVPVPVEQHILSPVYPLLKSLPSHPLNPPSKQKDLAELAEHKYGYRVLAQLLHPWCGRYLPPQLAAVARPPAKEYSAEAMRRPQHEVVAAAKAAEEAEEGQQGADGAAESDEDEEVRTG